MGQICRNTAANSFCRKFTQLVRDTTKDITDFNVEEHTKSSRSVKKFRQKSHKWLSNSQNRKLTFNLPQIRENFCRNDIFFH